MIKFPKNYKLIKEATDPLAPPVDATIPDSGAPTTDPGTGIEPPAGDPSLDSLGALPGSSPEMGGDSGMPGTEATDGAPGGLDAAGSILPSGGGGGGGGGGAGFTGGESGGGEEPTEDEKPENKGLLDIEDPVKAAKETMQFTTNIPEILKVIKASMENDDNAKIKIQDVIKKLKTEKNHTLHLVARRLELFMSPLLEGKRNMKQKIPSKTEILKEYIKEEIKLETARQLNENSHFTAERNLEDLAVKTIRDFEKHLLSELGLQPLDEMNPDSQEHYKQIVDQITIIFKTAIKERVKLFASLPKLNDVSSDKKSDSSIQSQQQ